MGRRLVSVALAVVTLSTSAACRDTRLPTAPGAPTFPPDLPTELTTASGLVVRASGEVISTGPTVLRIRATVTNPTGVEIVAATLADDCQIIVVASWQESPFIRLVQPLDGDGFTGEPLGSCGLRIATRVLSAGETLELAPAEDLVLSEVLSPGFDEGRYVISAIFVDEFIYEVLAIDTLVQD